MADSRHTGAGIYNKHSASAGVSFFKKWTAVGNSKPALKIGKLAYKISKYSSKLKSRALKLFSIG